MDFSIYFERYKSLVSQVENAFSRVQEQHAEAVKCKVGCSDCCHALFDLTLIEAIYINSCFNAKFMDKTKELLLEKANKADREIMKLKRKAQNDLQHGKNENDIIEEMGAKRVRCPMLNEKDCCDIYEFRPITCRLYGIPIEIGGNSRTCGQSAFLGGQSYPTIKIELVHKKLYEISFDLSQAIHTKYTKLAELLAPLSMALLTDYNETYLGVSQRTQEQNEAHEKE